MSRKRDAQDIESSGNSENDSQKAAKLPRTNLPQPDIEFSPNLPREENTQQSDEHLSQDFIGTPEDEVQFDQDEIEDEYIKLPTRSPSPKKVSKENSDKQHSKS